MILKRMTATFGKLEREQLDLEPGLNVIEAPNESGKSTWAAFLLSMLYGIDTAQRSSRTNLPDKTKYKPWNGQPMEGSLELQWQGRPVTIQRTGSDRAPMREFSAFDSETGNAVPLTESTCGQTLIGVERSVYERSGFLSFRCMAISGDHALEARLNALVSSGEESFSYTQVEKRLRDQRNRLRHNRLGLLPQAEEELRQVRQQMETLETLNREYRELEVRREQLAEQEKQLSERLSRLQARALSGKRQQLEAARQDWEKKAAFLRQKADSVAALPPLETLSATQGQLDATVDGLRQLESMVDLRKPMTPLEPPQCPPGFEGLTSEQVHETVEAECARLERLRCPPLYDGGAPGRMTGVAVVMGALAILGLFLKLWAMVIFGLVLAVVFAVQAGARTNRNHRARMQYRAILDHYNVDSMDELLDRCDSWRETLAEYSRQTAELKRQRNAWEIQMTHLGERMTELMASIRAFAPEIVDVTQAKAAIQRAIHLQQFYAAAQREEQSARSRYDALQEAIGPLPEPAADGSEDDGDPEEVAEAVRFLAGEDALSLNKHDQDIINVVFRGHIASLPDRYNMQSICFSADMNTIYKVYSDVIHISKEKLLEEKKNSVILHFMVFLGESPWNSNCKHPFGNIFMNYKKKSLWYDMAPIKMHLGIFHRIEKMLYQKIPDYWFLRLFRMVHDLFCLI